MNEENKIDLKKERIVEVDIQDDIKRSYLQYTMSVITSRAIPDARDGLKPVNRRIIYAMSGLGLTYDKVFKKSARVVGEVIGKYHPHGEASVYGSVVHLAQYFSMNHPLTWGHGNFGSIDGDEPAAQRYTEVKLTKLSNELIRDISKDTVDFRDNYDGSEREPIVLPCFFPNLLVNGVHGIAVGMATHIPPHNLEEICNATIKLANDPEITCEDLIRNTVNGPDFPTGGELLGDAGVIQAYLTGYGKYVLRSKYSYKHDGDTPIITITEIPYHTKKSAIIEKLGELAREKVITEISDLKDESSHNKISIKITLKRNTNVEVLMNKLFSKTDLEKISSINMLALVNNKPEILNIKRALQIFIDHQKEVIKRRTSFDLAKAEERLHILEGLKIALTNIDEVIKVIKESSSPSIAESSLIERFTFTNRQAKAILEMKLQRLTGLEKDKIITEHKDLEEKVNDLKDILANEKRVIDIFVDSQKEIMRVFSKPRQTEIMKGALQNMSEEDILIEEEVFVSVTKKGYLRRLDIETFRTQRRGGKGVSGATLYEDDSAKWIIQSSTKSRLFFFTNLGKVYCLKAFRLPLTKRGSKGNHISSLIESIGETNEKIVNVLSVSEEDEFQNLTLVTERGIVKSTSIKEFERINKNGKIAISLNENDNLLDVFKTSSTNELIIGSSNNKLVRFPLDSVRSTGRSSIGVKGINLEKDAKVVTATSVSSSDEILILCSNGKGKRTFVEDIRKIKRGGKGVNALGSKTSAKLLSICTIIENGDVLLTTKKGMVIRVPINDVRTLSRTAQGSTIFKIKEEDEIASVELLGDFSDETTEENIDASVSRETKEDANNE